MVTVGQILVEITAEEIGVDRQQAGQYRFGRPLVMFGQVNGRIPQLLLQIQLQPSQKVRLVEMGAESNPAVTDSELELLKELWQESPLTGPELIARTRGRTGWDESTVQTLLARLVTKKAIARAGKRRFYTYSPLLARSDYQREMTGRLAAQAFDNSAAELVSFFVRQQKLSAADRAELRQLLEELDADE